MSLMASKRSNGRSRAGRGREDSPDVKLSKFLSYLCRHGAHDQGLTVHEGGYIAVSDILALPRGRGYSEADVRRVVSHNDKQRFALKESEAGLLWIRANQGHSMEVSGLELRPIPSAKEVPCVVHGTQLRSWDQIRQQGLSRMQRNHIHFATGLPGDSGVISGMRSSSQVLIFVDLDKAMNDGYQFFQSANDVILCPGNRQGILPSEYFSKVIQLPAGKQLL